MRQAYEEVVAEQKAHQQRLDQARLQKEAIQEERRKARAARESAAAANWGIVEERSPQSIDSPSSAKLQQLLESPLSFDSPL